MEVSGTWESLFLLVAMFTGLGRSRFETSLVARGVPAAATAKSSGTRRVPVGELKTSWRGSDSGSLSGLIVAFESRVTFSGGSR